MFSEPASFGKPRAARAASFSPFAYPLHMGIRAVPSLSSVRDARSRILEIFELQRVTALRLRSSTAAERIAKIVALRDALIASRQAL